MSGCRHRFPLLMVMLLVFAASPLFAVNTLEVTSATTTPGSSTSVLALLTHDSDVQGFQVAMTYDNAALTLDLIDTAGLDVEFLLAPETIEFFTTTLDPAIQPGMGWGAAAAIFDFGPPFNSQVLSPGVQQSIAAYHFTVANDPLLIGTCTPLVLANGFSNPPIFNVITVGGLSVLPDLLPGGEICFVDLPTFRRGDSNGEGIINIADGIFLILYLFASGTEPPCLAAADANGDGFTDVSDAVTIINFQFLGGPPPPPPFPDCGPDPAGNPALSCNSYLGC